MNPVQNHPKFKFKASRYLSPQSWAGKINIPSLLGLILVECHMWSILTPGLPFFCSAFCCDWLPSATLPEPTKLELECYEAAVYGDLI